MRLATRQVLKQPVHGICRTLCKATSAPGDAQQPEVADTDPEGPSVENAADETQPSEVELLSKECDELKQELAEAKDRVLRTYAEMENVRTIAKRDVQNSKDFAVQSFAKSLLDVADNLGRAIDSSKSDDSSAEMSVLLGKHGHVYHGKALIDHMYHL